MTSSHYRTPAPLTSNHYKIPAPLTSSHYRTPAPTNFNPLQNPCAHRYSFPQGHFARKKRWHKTTQALVFLDMWHWLIRVYFFLDSFE